MNDRKFNIILMSAALIASVIALVLFFVFSKVSVADDEVDLGEVQEIPVDTVSGGDDDYWGGAAEEDCMTVEDYGYRVYVSNYPDLAPYIVSEGIIALEPYLDQYFNYYDPDGPNYEAEIDISSYNPDVNWPKFYLTVHMEDRDLEVCCVYWTQKGYYDFFSDLSGDAR